MAEYDKAFAEESLTEALTRIKGVFGIEEITPEQKVELADILEDYFNNECLNNCGDTF